MDKKEIQRQYNKELVSVMIFTTLILLAFVFGSLYYYTCSLPEGCLYNTHFTIFFAILFVLLLVMIRIEKHKLKHHILRIHEKIKRKNVLPPKPLDSIDSKLKGIEKNLRKTALPTLISDFSNVFKELTVRLLGIKGNFTYEELLVRLEKSHLQEKLRLDLIKTAEFLQLVQYKDKKLSLSELRELVRYTRNLVRIHNFYPPKPKTPKYENLKPKLPSPKHAHYIALFIVLFIAVGAYVSGSMQGITGFSTYQVTEGTGGSVTVFTIADQTVVEGHNLSIIVYANDSDSEAITFDIGDSDPSWVNITTISSSTAGGANATGNLTFTPASTGDTGDNYNVTIIARSVDNDAASEGINVNVTENTAPTANVTIPNMTWPEDTVNNSYDLDDYFNDTENDTLSYTYSGNTNIAISIASGVATLTPTSNWNGTETITFTASDGIDTTNSNAVLMNVTGVYDQAEMSGFAVLPSSPHNLSNLTCSWTVASNDTTANITANVSWYILNTSWQLEMQQNNVTCSANGVCNASELIFYTNTSIDDVWNCTANISDQSNYTFFSANNTIVSAAPTILTVTTNSNDYNRTPINSSAIFNVTWSDVDTLNISTHICSTSSGNTSGCNGTELCGVNSTNATIISCNYTVLATDVVNTSVWVFACDDTTCSNTTTTFYVNQIPAMNEVTSTFNYLSGTGITFGNGEFDAPPVLNQQAMFKLNSSALYTLDKINVSNATFYISITELLGNWTGGITVLSITNQSWLTNDSIAALTSLTGTESNFTEINTTAVRGMNVSDLVTAAYASNLINISLKISATQGSGTLNDSEIPTTYFSVGDNDTGSTLGGMTFSTTTNITANLTKLIPDYNWNMNVVQSGPDLDSYFYDPDGYDLNFSTSGSSYVTVAIANDTHIATFTPTSGWYGTETINFIATDAANETMYSNLVSLTVNYVAGDTVTTTTTSSSSSTKVKRMSIELTANDIELYPTDAKILQMQVSNTGDVNLDKISLAALFPSITGLSGSLQQTYISRLEPEENVTVEVALKSENVTPGKYNVTLNGNVGDPASVRDIEIFTVWVKEDDENSFAGRVRFVTDLFRTNPECTELLPNIKDAQTLYNNGQKALADQKLSAFIKECKDRISSDADKTFASETRGVLEERKVEIIIGLFILSALYIFSLVLNKF
ncbi:hypothetical protein HOD83_00115 [Candidatus Woesearchaeota archaeon]|jgi:hypothetical protein|nr:hypothetical protein [Candidatus Woesearchaeota archaeon]MBT4247984.1 hypothetical protein [Candidatus Woesearchaeota archaeon]